jgi:hypothetical protein
MRWTPEQREVLVLCRLPTTTICRSQEIGSILGLFFCTPGAARVTGASSASVL